MVKMVHRFEKEYFRDVYAGDYLRRNPPYKINSYLSRILAFKKDGRLLDIGCAYGLFLKAASKNFECEGIDISKHAISVAKKYVTKEVKLHVGSVENMRLNRGFDVICCFDVLEHLPNLDKALRTIKNYLNNDGIFIMSVPVYDGFIGKFVAYLDKDETHLTKESRNFWLKQVKADGFKIELFEGIFRYFLLKSFYLHFVSSIVRRYSPAIIIVARK
jgi:2-polyprenyl-3-methyl-5-hydroxy-6-metoxy-1,4-benzoquinol methylase